ncbi:MAG: class I mannose-6-phosphate isomerase [Parasphingopyxis sp.]
MPVTRLATRRIEKVWGRRHLGLGFVDPEPGGEPIGEIWYQSPDGAPDDLLVKYLFTSAKLSVQVHPDDDQARAAGHRSGKEECWLILEAEPDAAIGLGLTREADSDELRAAALDGSIEGLLDWKPVKPGDVFYLPAGTVHAIGAGVTLVEVQQNVDLTYRLYDYGRPRDLHLDEAIGVATGEPWQAPSEARMQGTGRKILAEGRKFVLERWGDTRCDLAPADGRPIWLIPLEGGGRIGEDLLEPGGVWIAEGSHPLDYRGDLLVAYPQGDVVEELTP